MRKAIISNRIYLSKTNDLLDKCLKALTYKIPSGRPKVPPEIICDIVLNSGGVFSIPVARTDLIPKDYEITDKRNYAPIHEKDLDIILREDQIDIFNQVTDNCLINAAPGWGKTFVSLFIANKLGQKTLVVVHNTVLRDQWVEEVEKVFNYTPGIIGSNKFQTDTDIVISNTQTLTKHMTKYSNMFGTLICDEVHRVPANTFKKIVDSSYARYKIGLSATMGRKDRKHVIIPDYFSNKIYIPSIDTGLAPTIYCIYTNISLPSSGHWANKITELHENPEYIQLLTEIADIKSNLDGHKVLLVADRIEFLKQCHSIVPNSELVTSEIKNRKEIHKKLYTDKANSLFGITSIYKEGINIPPLSCLILGSPINNRWLLEQVIGRVTRPYEGKKNPEIMDIVLKDKLSRRQFAERLNYYISKGYKIIEVSND